MGLSEIAAGIEVTDEQRDSGVPTVDDTGADPVERLTRHADALPCTPRAAATVIEGHAAGERPEAAARRAAVAPMTAAKVLHRCGVAGVSPLSPGARAVVRDWLDGEIPRSEAVALVGADEAEFALAAYVETHDAVPGLVDAAEGLLEPDEPASVAKRDALDETMSGVPDLR